MSKLSLTVKCKTCQDGYAESSRDKNNPFFGDDAEFGVVLEWETKEGAVKILQNTKCPKCGSDDWYFTDYAEH